MSWLGDLGSFELFNLKGMANQVKDNPARLLYGAADPFSTSVWNKILGRDDKPLVDQWGGAASHRYDEAEDAGINTGAGKQMHGVAKAIASIYAGGYGSSALGGATGSSTGGLLGNTAQSAGSTGYGIGQPVVSGGVGNASYAGSQGGGLLSNATSTMSSAMDTAKPYIEAYQTGSQLMGQGQQRPVAQSPAPVTPMPGGGTDALASLANNGRMAQNNMLQSAEAGRQQRRMNRRGLI